MFLNVVKILMQLICAVRTGTSQGWKHAFTFWRNSITVTCNSSSEQFNLSFRSPSFQLSIIIAIKNYDSPSCKAKVWGAAQRHDAECTLTRAVFKSDKETSSGVYLKNHSAVLYKIETSPIKTYRLVFLHGIGESGYPGILSVIL